MDKTVRENLRTAIKPTLDMVDRFNEISEQLGDPEPDDDMDKLMEEMGALQEKIDACDGWETDRLMDIVSDAMVLPPDDAPISRLSGGERRRVALCMALLEKPDLLLLDEPTNHLDAETVQWLETALREYPGTVIIVTHDRYFLDNITKWILELENGAGLAVRRQLLVLAQAEGRVAAGHREEGNPAAKDPDARTGLDQHLGQGAQPEEPGPHQRLRATGRPVRRRRRGDVLIQIPSGPAAGRQGAVVQGCQQGL